MRVRGLALSSVAMARACCTSGFAMEMSIVPMGAMKRTAPVRAYALTVLSNLFSCQCNCHNLQPLPAPLIRVLRRCAL